MSTKGVLKTAIEVVLVAVCIFIFFSCFSFHIADAPGTVHWPQNNPAANWCGQSGAYIAYYLLYYIGPGIFIGIVALAWILIAHIMGSEIGQWALRILGLVLLILSASITYYLLWPIEHYWPYQSGGFPLGNGGIIGVGIGDFLRIQFADFGTAIIVISSWIVGAVLLADTVVIAAVKWVGSALWKAIGLVIPAFHAAREKTEAISDIWRRLSTKQRKRQNSSQSSKKRGAKLLQSRSEKLETLLEDEEEIEEDLPEEEYEDEVEEVQEPPKKTKKRLFSGIKRHKKQKKKKSKKSAKTQRQEAYVPKSYEDYQLPPVELLAEPEYGFGDIQEQMVGDKARILEELLREFGVEAHVVNAEPGPTITMYELRLAAGIKVSQISNLSNDMARALGAGSVRVVAPLPGRHTIGIEVPNSQRETVRLKELIQLAGKKQEKMQIPLFLGKDSSGEALISDLAAMPHLLIAGTTGSGKSVCINSIITSVLLTRRPDEVKMILVDPKMVEMASFDMIPHLMCPTVTDTRRAEQILEWATTKMDERYELLAEAKVRNVAAYNRLGPEEIVKRFNPSTQEEEAKIPKRLPYIVIVIDELADLMMTSAKEVEAYIVRIAQKSRAVGIHLVIATQRPQATVVTGLIKSNMPARIAFRVAARMDSRIILDQNGGETLLGQGDMLFLIPGTSDLVRSQGAFLDDDEIHGVVGFLKDVAQPQFHPELMQLNKIDLSAAKKDDLFDEAVQIVLETKRGSVSLLQRRLAIGYARASRIIEMMAASGILGEYKGSQAREVIMTADEWKQAKANAAADAVAGYSDLQDDELDEEEVEEEYLDEEDEEEGDYEEDYDDEYEYEDEEDYDEEEEEEVN